MPDTKPLMTGIDFFFTEELCCINDGINSLTLLNRDALPQDVAEWKKITFQELQAFLGERWGKDEGQGGLMFWQAYMYANKTHDNQIHFFYLYATKNWVELFYMPSECLLSSSPDVSIIDWSPKRCLNGNQIMPLPLSLFMYMIIGWFQRFILKGRAVPLLEIISPKLRS